HCFSSDFLIMQHVCLPCDCQPREQKSNSKKQGLFAFGGHGRLRCSAKWMYCYLVAPGKEVHSLWPLVRIRREIRDAQKTVLMRYMPRSPLGLGAIGLVAAAAILRHLRPFRLEARFVLDGGGGHLGLGRELVETDEQISLVLKRGRQRIGVAGFGIVAEQVF